MPRRSISTNPPGEHARQPAPRPHSAKGPVTLKDVARAANVSVAAASLALADAPRISARTKALIRRVSAELNYRPLRRRVPGVGPRGAGRPVRRVGLALIDPRDDIGKESTQWLRRLDPLAVTMRLKLELAMIAEADFDSQRARLAHAADGVDALLLLGYVTRELVEHAQALGRRFVVLGAIEGDPARPRPAVCSVASDAHSMGRYATTALLRAGHRRVGFVCLHNPPGLWYDSWLAGYRHAHQDAGVPADPALARITGAASQREAGALGAEAFLAMKDPPTAFVFPDPGTAVSLRQHFAAAGRPVPGGALVASEPDDDTYPALEDAPRITEDSPVLTRLTMQIVRMAADGQSPPAAWIAPPYRVRNFEAITPVN